MGNVYELHADESWTHEGLGTGRYYNFFGGVFAEESEMDRLQTRLRRVREQHDLRIAKVNYKYINDANVVAFQAFADAFFDHIEEHDVRYRQMFLDRSYVHVDHSGNVTTPSREELLYKAYYQFLKHAFCPQALPSADSQSPHRIRIRLDHSSTNVHRSKLEQLACDLPRIWGRSDIDVSLDFVRAKTSQAMQLTDLLCGCAAFHGNKMKLIRAPGVRGMTAKQRLKDSLAKHIYNRFRSHDAKRRGSKAFNWFESTSFGTVEERHFQKVRIWKFKPYDYVRDFGWENDNLEKGRYVAPIMGAERGRKDSDF